ncbi:hypothetical protein M378DRAFT_163578, partial [Amanita muscaria Koide BX008]
YLRKGTGAVSRTLHSHVWTRRSGNLDVEVERTVLSYMYLSENSNNTQHSPERKMDINYVHTGTYLPICIMIQISPLATSI